MLIFASSLATIAYDNYRDDHGHDRELTQCDGVLRWTGSEIEVHLVPQVNYPPKLRAPDFDGSGYDTFL